ncbi:hypothetical protein EMPS_08495 [Entomortierella parvispora]|uniref:F-box domain-containing protein n=1 Tax=Entomortierella parvispora TaxID=205924 RepID=A0A9P3LZ52_9FUNG|nr:hypothetical protein EMPS_08495 [Entomortierella parvispora]
MFSHVLSRMTSSLFHSNGRPKSPPTETTPTTATLLKSASPGLGLAEILQRISQHLSQEDLLRCMLVSRTFYYAFGQQLWTQVTIELRTSESRAWSRGPRGSRRRGYRSQSHPGQWIDERTCDPMDQYVAKMALFLDQLVKNIHHVRELRIYYGNSIHDPSLVPDKTRTAGQIVEDENAFASDDDDHEEDDPVHEDGIEDGEQAAHLTTSSQILGKIKDVLRMNGLERLRHLSLIGDSRQISGRAIPLELLVELGLFIPTSTKAQRPGPDVDCNGHTLNGYSSRFRNLQSLDIILVENMSQVFQVEDVLRACPLLENLRIDRAIGPLFEIDHNDASEPEIHSSKLKRLSFGGMRWPNKEFLELARRCPHLMSLTLVGHVRSPWTWTSETVDELVKCCPDLVEIHINPGYRSAFQEELSTRLLEGLPCLRVFKIPGGNFGERTFEALMRVMTTATSTQDASGSGPVQQHRLISQLEELDLSSTRKPGLSNEMLVQLMSYAFNLRILNASGVSLSPRQFVIAEPEPVQGIKGTGDDRKTVDLNPLPRPPQGWRCHKLEEISIGFAMADVTFRGCNNIYATLGQLLELRQIHILPNHLPLTLEEGLGQLATLKHLRHLDIHGVSNVGRYTDPASGKKAITEEVIQWMVQAWPKLESLRLYLDPPKRQSLAEVRQWLVQAGRGDVRIYVD